MRPDAPVDDPGLTRTEAQALLNAAMEVEPDDPTYTLLEGATNKLIRVLYAERWR